VKTNTAESNAASPRNALKDIVHRKKTLVEIRYHCTSSVQCNRHWWTLMCQYNWMWDEKYYFYMQCT